MKDSITIRMAQIADAGELLEIYRPYVEHTAISFEYDVPTEEEFAGRIEKTQEMYPYLVAEMDGEIIGYAYVSPFKERKAYDWAVETSVYIKEGYKGQGWGKKLYTALEDILRRQNITNLYACIAYTDQEDEYLTNASVDFHRHMGYRLAGTFYRCGYKFGRWYDMVWMEKMIAVQPEHPDPILPVIAVLGKN